MPRKIWCCERGSNHPLTGNNRENIRLKINRPVTCILKWILKERGTKELIRFHRLTIEICWIKRDQLDVTCFIISLFNAQHVSDVNTSILRSLRLICWVISWVVLLWFVVCWFYVVDWLGWCGIRMQAEANPWNNTTNKSQAPEDGCVNIWSMLSNK